MASEKGTPVTGRSAMPLPVDTSYAPNGCVYERTCLSVYVCVCSCVGVSCMCVNVLGGMGIDESCHSFIRMYTYVQSI